MVKAKINGSWETVAYGTQTWVGTQAQFAADLAAGKISEGACAIITDDNSFITVKNATVAVADWVADSTYTGFGYKAEITVQGCTANHSPDVRFNFTDASSGNFAPVADTTTGKVIIYAAAVPAAAITIPAIILDLIA
jgi:hypothetical protein